MVRPGPARWLSIVAGLGWGALIGHAIGFMGFGAVAPVMDGHQMAGVDMAGTDTSAYSTQGWVMVACMWAAMLAATMLPLVAPNVRFVAARSPRRRRTAATAEVVAGWALSWAAAAVAIALASGLLVHVLGRPQAIVVAFSLAAVWQLSRAKRVAVARCHRTFAPPLDGCAPRACRGFGRRLGADCVTSCWALMAAMAVCDHRLLIVAPLAWVPWFERRRPHHLPGTGVTLIVLAAVGVTAATTVGS